MKAKKYFYKNWQLWVMLFPAMLYIFIFCYVPMYGIQLAFRDYDFTKGIAGGAWAGLKYFKQYFFAFILPLPFCSTQKKYGKGCSTHGYAVYAAALLLLFS